MDKISIANIERAVLGSVIFEPDNLYILKEALNPKDFYLAGHREVFTAMLELENEDMPLDEDFILKKAHLKNINEKILLDILSANPITNVKAYVKQIKTSSVRREVLSLSFKLKRVGEDENLASEQIAEILEDECYKIIDNANAYQNESVSSAVQEYITRFEQVSSPLYEDRFIKTGINGFDNIFKGFEKGQYIIIGARPSMGKSALAFQIALNCIKNDKAVIIDSLEMPRRDVILRMIAQENEEDIGELLSGRVKDYDKHHQTLKYLDTNKNLVIHDKVLSFNNLKSKFQKIKRIRDKQGLKTDVWIIDHLGYVKTSYKLKRHEELSLGSKMLKELAKELNITIIALSQLNRNVTSRSGGDVKYRPNLSDLKDSGSLEEDADMVIFVHRDSYYLKSLKNEIEDDVNTALLLILKNRNGKTGVVKCDFKGSINKFGIFPVMEYVYTNSYYKDNESINDTELVSNILN